MNRSEVLNKLETFRDRCQPNLYDYFYAFRPYHLVSCCAFGPPVHTHPTCVRQTIYFGTRADEYANYNKNNNLKWTGGAASLLAVAEVDIAQQGYQLERNSNRSRLTVEQNEQVGTSGSSYQQFLKG